MEAKRHLVTQLNKLITDERLYPNRRFLAVLLVGMLRTEGEEHEFFKNLISSQFLTGHGVQLADNQDKGVPTPQTNIEKNAQETINNFLTQFELGGSNESDKSS